MRRLREVAGARRGVVRRPTGTIGAAVAAVDDVIIVVVVVRRLDVGRAVLDRRQFDAIQQFGGRRALPAAVQLMKAVAAVVVRVAVQRVERTMKLRLRRQRRDRAIRGAASGIRSKGGAGGRASGSGAVILRGGGASATERRRACKTTSSGAFNSGEFFSELCAIFQKITERSDVIPTSDCRCLTIKSN